eukprot:jgi/Pico_ML_1/53077/g3691.t1
MRRRAAEHVLGTTCSGVGTDLGTLPDAHGPILLDNVDVESMRRIAEVQADDSDMPLDRGKLLWTRPKASSQPLSKAPGTSEGTAMPRRERRERTKRKAMDL